MIGYRLCATDPMVYSFVLVKLVFSYEPTGMGSAGRRAVGSVMVSFAMVAGIGMKLMSMMMGRTAGIRFRDLADAQCVSLDDTKIFQAQRLIQHFKARCSCRRENR